MYVDSNHIAAYYVCQVGFPLFLLCIFKLQSPVAERSKARVYGRSLAGIASSNPAGGMDGCPL